MLLLVETYFPKSMWLYLKIVKIIHASAKRLEKTYRYFILNSLVLTIAARNARTAIEIHEIMTTMIGTKKTKASDAVAKARATVVKASELAMLKIM